MGKIQYVEPTLSFVFWNDHFTNTSKSPREYLLWLLLSLWAGVVYSFNPFIQTSGHYLF